MADQPEQDLRLGLGRDPAWSVSQVNQRARQLLETHFGRVVVVGEVSNLRVVSGHHYFSLKDESSQLAAVLFKREASLARVIVRDGMQLRCVGRLTIYAPRGTYQIVVERVEAAGAGALQAAFEQLKTRLAAEGLFESSRKRPLPAFPGRVAVITSPTGAVIRDILQVATRRFPRAQILVVPTRVQGAESARDVVASIERVDRLAGSLGLDALIVARGGGSLEDLWAFNEEGVARAIAATKIPVVSAIGHETDFTIADFVADLRAPTPSAAAELVFPSAEDLSLHLAALTERLERAVRRDLAEGRHRLTGARAGLRELRARVAVETQRLDQARANTYQAILKIAGGFRARLADHEKRLTDLHPRTRLRGFRAGLQRAGDRLDWLMVERLRANQARLAAVGGRLDALSPLAVLSRGYGIVLDESGNVVRTAAQVQVGAGLDIRLGTGRISARAEQILAGESV